MTDDEKAVWWARAVETWPAYDAYQAKTTRQIPVFVLEPIEAARSVVTSPGLEPAERPLESKRPRVESYGSTRTYMPARALLPHALLPRRTNCRPTCLTERA